MLGYDKTQGKSYATQTTAGEMQYILYVYVCYAAFHKELVQGKWPTVQGVDPEDILKVSGYNGLSYKKTALPLWP